MIKSEQKIIILAIVGVAVVWIADAAFDSFIVHEGPFLRLLTDITSRETFLRISLTVSLLVFGVVLSRITASHKRVELRQKRHAAAIESSMDGIALYNQEGEYVHVNQAYASINGYADPEEFIGKTFGHAYDEKEVARMEQILGPALQKSGQWRGELLAKRKNGSAYYQEASVSKLEDGGRVYIIRDITWRKRSEERARRSERFLNTIFDSIRDPFSIFDGNFQVIRVNEAYAQMKSRRVDELIGKKCHEALLNSNKICEGCIVDKTLHSADPCAKDKLVTMPDGNDVWMEIYTYPIMDDEGQVSHVIEYTRDITDRKKSEEEKRRLIEKLEHLSRTDGLTGLMNRRALTESLAHEIDRAKRYSSDLSLILCDIDNFKEINDAFGHDSGDRALQTIAGILKTLHRKADLAGRYGGDEFMLVLPETSVKGAENFADKLLSILGEADFQFLGETRIRLSMSIGVAGLDPSVDSLDRFVKRADDAMYASKQGGRNRISIARL